MLHRTVGRLLGGSAFLVLVLAGLGWAQPPKLDQAPKGFDLRRDKIERGKLETVEYDSKTVGDLLKAAGLKLVQFARLKVGELG